MTKTSKNEFGKETQAWSNDFSKAAVLSTIPVMDLDERLRAVEKRLLLIAPSDGVLSKYPALKEAYDNYRIIEKLTLGDEDHYEADK